MVQGKKGPQSRWGPGGLTLMRSDALPYCRTWLEVVCAFDDQYTIYNHSRAHQECAYLAHGTTIIVAQNGYDINFKSQNPNAYSGG